MIFTLKIVLVTSLSWGKESGNKINLVTYNSYSPKEKSRIFYKLVQNNPGPWISFTELLSPDNDVAKTRSNVNISRVVGQDFFSCWSLLFLRIAIFFFCIFGQPLWCYKTLMHLWTAVAVRQISNRKKNGFVVSRTAAVAITASVLHSTPKSKKVQLWESHN